MTTNQNIFILLLACITLFSYKINSTVCGEYVTKPTGEFFYTKHILRLNSDSTFTFSRYTCLGLDTSFGKWCMKGEKVSLSKTKKLNRLLALQKPFERINYIDITDKKLLLTANYLIFEVSDKWIDTLCKK